MGQRWLLGHVVKRRPIESLRIYRSTRRARSGLNGRSSRLDTKERRSHGVKHREWSFDPGLAKSRRKTSAFLAFCKVPGPASVSSVNSCSVVFSFAILEAFCEILESLNPQRSTGSVFDHGLPDIEPAVGGIGVRAAVRFKAIGNELVHFFVQLFRIFPMRRFVFNNVVRHRLKA